MKLTIVPNDNLVIVDGEPESVDLSHLPEGIHAIQWDGENGEIEYTKPPNRKIKSLDEVGEPVTQGRQKLSRALMDSLVTAHRDVKAARLAAAKEEERLMQVAREEMEASGRAAMEEVMKSMEKKA